MLDPELNVFQNISGHVTLLCFVLTLTDSHPLIMLCLIKYSLYDTATAPYIPRKYLLSQDLCPTFSFCPRAATAIIIFGHLLSF